MKPETEAAQLDAAALARLRELDPDGRHDVLRRVFTAFEAALLRMQQDLQALDPPAGQPAADVVLRWAHTLKSSGASVGALALARACNEIEMRLRHEGLHTLGEDRQLLLAQAAAARAAVRAMLRD